jgi:hypothetical protein
MGWMGYEVPVKVEGEDGGNTFVSREEARSLGLTGQQIEDAIASGVPIPVSPVSE